MSVQQFVIDRSTRENVLIVKEMNFLLIAHRDVSMLRQKIMQRGRARFLRARNGEIEPLDLS